MATIFSEDFSGISTGASWTEDSNWVVDTWDNANSYPDALEESGRGVMRCGSGIRAGPRIEPASAAWYDTKAELRFNLDWSDTAITTSIYPRLLIGVRADQWGTATWPPTDQWGFEPRYGWYYDMYPKASATVRLARSIDMVDTTLVNSTNKLTTSWGRAEFRIQIEKSGTDWIHRFRCWEYGQSEPGTWTFTHTDTAPGTADDHASGFYGFSAMQWGGTNTDLDLLVDNIVVTDMVAGTTAIAGALTARRHRRRHRTRPALDR